MTPTLSPRTGHLVSMVTNATTSARAGTELENTWPTPS